MLVHEIHCPRCGAGLKSKAGVRAGAAINCPKCKHRFSVEPPEEPDIVDDTEVIEVVPSPRKKPAPPPPPARANSRKNDEATEEMHLPKTKKIARNRPSRDDDDEEPARPRKQKKKTRRSDDDEENLFQRLKSNVLVRVITMVILLTILGVLGYLLYEKRRAEAESAGLHWQYCLVEQGQQSI